jgi:acyl dehydratase
MIANGIDPKPREFGPVTQTDIVRFAGAGGDFNPLHHDPARARAAGFDAPIAMGQFTAGLLAGWLTDSFGVENLRSFEVRFTSPVQIGDLVQLTGRVTEVRDGVAHLEVAALVSGKPVVSGTATLLDFGRTIRPHSVHVASPRDSHPA